jgi:HEAT repeat protein
MAGSGLQEKAIEALVVMNPAIINLRMYPPTNAMIVQTVGRLYDILQTILETEETLLFSESDRNLLISGEPLNQKNRERPQVAILLMLMMNWGIKSIGFHKNMDKSELSSFLEIMGRKPDDAMKAKGIEQLVAEREMRHIQINQKVYVEMGKDREIGGGIDITEEEIVRYITAEDHGAALDPTRLQEMAKDREWVSRIFRSGMSRLAGGGKTESPGKLSESVVRMLRALDTISDDEGKKALSRLAAKSISDLNADAIVLMMTQNMEGLLGNRLLEQVVDQIEPDKLERVVLKLRQAGDGASTGEGFDRETIESAQQAYRQLKDTEKGAQLLHQIEEKQAREKEERENERQEIQKTVLDLLNSIGKGLADQDAIKSLTEKTAALCSEGEIEMVDAIIDRLIGQLQSDQSVVRAAASESLAQILDRLSPKRRTDLITRHQEALLTWMKSETQPADSFKTICVQLRELAQARIRSRLIAEGIPLLEAFRFMAARRLETDDRIQSIAFETLKETATPEVLDILLEEFRSDQGGRRNEAGQSLVMTAPFSTHRLLDLLKEGEDGAERGLILNLIPQIGPSAARAVIERIEESAPWYYLRNLARLLGRVGSAEDAKALVPLMAYDDLRVQREAFKSITGIGGAFKGQILLSALAGCNDELKAGVVSALGSLKHRAAVTPLIELFKSKLGLSDEMKVELQEKICLALGSIGNKEALPFLTSVSKQSGIFGFKAYHPKVKNAAVRAAAMLSKA